MLGYVTKFAMKLELKDKRDEIAAEEKQNG